MQRFMETQEIPVVGNYEVLVAGGGVAGISAALAAGRAGKRVLLLEKSVMLGGLATLGLINWYEPLCDGCGKQMTYGIAEELLCLSIAYGPDSLPEQWREKHGQQDTQKRYATHFSPTAFAMALDGLLLDAGVDLCLDIMACRPVMEGRRCIGVITESKSGRECYMADIVIDTTGDADLLARAGVPCRIGENFLSYFAHQFQTKDACEAQTNPLTLRHWACLGANAIGKGHPEGCRTFQGITCKDVTEFVLAGRKLLFQQVQKEPRLSSEITSLPGMAQFRMTRCIVGSHTLTEADDHCPHEDSVGLIGDFLRRGSWYEIPYRCLYHPKYDNLLTAGRTISAKEHGWQVTRVIPSAALTGQAAGIAAATALNHACAVGEVPLGIYQQTLYEVGVRVHHG